MALPLGTGPASAQQGPALGFPLGTADQGVTILVVDQERIFAESLFGLRVAAEIDRRSRLLASENRQLESELEEEERRLTDLRPSLDPEEFRRRADAFNRRVQQIREDQDAKSRALAAFRDSEQQRFLSGLGPVLTDIASERAAVAVFDRRLLLVAAQSVDITGEAIERVNEGLGDGAPLMVPEDGSGPEVAPAEGGDGSGADPARTGPAAGGQQDPQQ